MRLNLGAGDKPLPDYDNSFDLQTGKAAYPLPLADGVADEIRASHIFEHFSHRAALDVLRDWVRVLKPGGLIKLAVPDLEYIARGYLSGHPAPWVGYLCGGHLDQHDVHLAQYDAPSLAGLMDMAGLVGVHYWQGEHDWSAEPVSLNLAAWKPLEAWPKVVGVMSVPRLGFMDNFFSAVEVLAKLRIPLQKTTGAFWGQCITRSMENAIADGAEWVLTLDYDTVYDVGTVVDLLATATLNPGIDAIVPLQMGRTSGHPLMTFEGPDGKPLPGLDRDTLKATTLPLLTGHFGCTLLRASAFASLERPWFLGEPDAQGRWGTDRRDDDITFWRKWRAAGNTVVAAPRCVVGHAELQIIWPNRNLENILQHPSDYWKTGAPMDVWR